MSRVTRTLYGYFRDPSIGGYSPGLVDQVARLHDDQRDMERNLARLEKYLGVEQVDRGIVVQPIEETE